MERLLNRLAVIFALIFALALAWLILVPERPLEQSASLPGGRAASLTPALAPVATATPARRELQWPWPTMDPTIRAGLIAKVTPQPTQAPAERFPYVPDYPGAREQAQDLSTEVKKGRGTSRDSMSEQLLITFIISDSPAVVRAYYAASVSQHGWVLQTADPARSSSLLYLYQGEPRNTYFATTGKYAGPTLLVSVEPDERGGSRVRLTLRERYGGMIIHRRRLG